MPLHLALGLALLAVVAGGGGAWLVFASDLKRQTDEIDDLYARLDDTGRERDINLRRALDAEKNLELVVADAERHPLSAPVQMIRGSL